MTIGNAKPVLAQTQIAGGPGVQFDDAREVASWPLRLEIAENTPISEIIVRHGWIINNLTIIYRTVNGNSASVSHGVDSGGTVNKIPLNENEIVTSVQGKAGLHSSYQRPYLCSISFTILDTKTLASRTTGIFGNGDNLNQGDPFQIAQPYAFAGTTYTDGQAGVAGLSAYKVLTNV